MEFIAITMGHTIHSHSPDTMMVFSSTGCRYKLNAAPVPLSPADQFTPSKGTEFTVQQGDGHGPGAVQWSHQFIPICKTIETDTSPIRMVYIGMRTRSLHCNWLAVKWVGDMSWAVAGHTECNWMSECVVTMCQMQIRGHSRTFNWQSNGKFFALFEDLIYLFTTDRYMDMHRFCIRGKCDLIDYTN